MSANIIWTVHNDGIQIAAGSSAFAVQLSLIAGNDGIVGAFDEVRISVDSGRMSVSDVAFNDIGAIDLTGLAPAEGFIILGDASGDYAGTSVSARAKPPNSTPV